MAHQTIFKRYELKYMLTKAQAERIKRGMEAYMQGDAYGRSTICNIYYDTPSFLLVRRSIEKPVYKEKLRLRSYGVATPDSTTFVELKKKYEDVVYKRRVALPEHEAMAYLSGQSHPADTQIVREIDYARRLYRPLQPAVFLSYEREAFYAKDDPNFRVTFDERILWRDTDLSLCAGVGGTPILREGQALMEIKTGTAIPLWMVQLLSDQHIYKTSFSKYGTAYQMRQLQTKTGGLFYA